MMDYNKWPATKWCLAANLGTANYPLDIIGTHDLPSLRLMELLAISSKSKTQF